MTAPDTAAIRAQMDALRGFTPGPWATDCDDCHFGTLSSVRGGRAAQKQGLRRELMVEVGGWQGVKAQEATTRLIAAAPEMRATILTLCDALEAERAEIERLRAALAPFSEESAYWFSHNYNREDRPVEGFPGYTPVMTCGDLFNARAALAQKGGE